MCFGGVGAVGAAFADGCFANNQGGFIGAVFSVRNGFAYSSSVMAVDCINHVPAISGKTLRRVVNEPRRHLAVNGDAVVVVHGNQLVELPSASQSACFVADAFHQATVAHEHIRVVVNDVVTGLVEFGGQQFFGQGHAHGIGDALTQRAGGGFDAGGDAHFGVTGGFAVQLTEVFQLRHGQWVACEVQQGINEHGAVSVGQHEAIAVGPMRVLGVVLQVLTPQSHSHVGHAHRRTWVARIGLLNSVHGQGTDGVGHLMGCGLGDCHGGSK